MGKVQDSGQQITIIFLTASKYIIWWIVTCTYTLHRAMISCLILECDCVWAACSAIPRGGSLLTNNISKQHTTPKPGVTCNHIFRNITCIPLGWGRGTRDAIFSNKFGVGPLASVHQLCLNFMVMLHSCLSCNFRANKDKIKIFSLGYLVSLIDAVWDTIHCPEEGYHWFCNAHNFCTFFKKMIYVYCLRGCNDGW